MVGVHSEGRPGYTYIIMLVFIDESGCPGFKFARGSDPVFGIGMVIFSTGADARLTEQAMMAVRERTGHKPEIKFSKSSDELRDTFFPESGRVRLLCGR